MKAIVAIISFLYPFWPLTTLLGIKILVNNQRPFGHRVRSAMNAVFLGWLVWASFRLFLNWCDQQPALIMPKAVDQAWFLTMGSVFGGISILGLFSRWHKGWVRLAKVNHLEDLKSLAPEDFEEIVAKIFRSNGFKATLSGGQADHGVDLVVMNDQGERWIVQCKRYSGSVGEPVVRDLYGTLLHEEAQGAYLMTTGTFTKNAQEWATGKPIILYDGDALIDLIRKIKL